MPSTLSIERRPTPAPLEPRVAPYPLRYADARDAAVTGAVNADVLDYGLATTATQFSGVNTYPITVTLGTNPNYEVSKTDGVLTIGKA